MCYLEAVIFSVVEFWVGWILYDVRWGMDVQGGKTYGGSAGGYINCIRGARDHGSTSHDKYGKEDECEEFHGKPILG